ncbi:hypothetical protein EYR38_010754 [Pleurotus pulmonarius]|nr:hypothetical protein EYR38_010754 [Pleurotus pulmonarius]
MTQLRIIRTLFSRESTTRKHVIQVVTEWLRSAAIMQAISNRLGYPVRRLQSKERHRSEDREPHITIRGYRHGRGVLTAHIYVDDRYVRQGSAIFATGARVRAKTSCVYFDIYNVSMMVYEANAPQVAMIRASLFHNDDDRTGSHHQWPEHGHFSWPRQWDSVRLDLVGAVGIP